MHPRYGCFDSAAYHVLLVATQDWQYNSVMIVAHYPGAELIEAGLADLTAGLVTLESLLVSIAAPGLRDVGLAVD